MALPPPTYAQFIVLFPEFVAITEATIQAKLDASVRLLDEESWGDNYFDAISYDTAHNLALALMATQGGVTGGLQAGIGQITSSSAAGMSTSFAQMNLNSKSYTDFWYSKTSYGQYFLRLRSVTIAPGIMAV